MQRRCFYEIAPFLGGMIMANSTFHIGELSNLFNISVDSIRYYEKKGLICPTRNENNGYREYSLDDFQTLVMIRELLGLDFHKEQISEFLKNRNISTTMEMLDTELSIIKEKMEVLQKKKEQIVSRIQSLQAVQNESSDTSIQLKTFKKRPIAMISTKNLPDAYVDYTMVQYMKKNRIKLDTNGEIKFWKAFPEGPRKDATYFPKIILSDGELHDWWYDTDPPSREVVAPVFMKTVEGAVRGTEFDYTNPALVNAAGEKTLQLIRLSQVYCWYAEATGRSGEVNTKAIEVLNKVRNRADGQETNFYKETMTPEALAEAAYDEHGWEIAGYYWGGIASRARDMFRMYRYKDHFEYRKENPLIKVAEGIERNEAVPVTGTWDDSKMYAPYPYEDAILNPNLK